MLTPTIPAVHPPTLPTPVPPTVVAEPAPLPTVVDTTEADWIAAEAFAKRAADAKEAAEIQAIASAAVTTERGIQCQKAHELIDLWFYGDWDTAKFQRWAVLTASENPPSLAQMIAAMGLLLGGMTPPPPPPARARSMTRSESQSDEPQPEPPVPDPTFGVAPQQYQ